MAGIARRIRFAIHRSDFARTGLDASGALAGCSRERPLSRGEPGDGMAARRFSGADGKEVARPSGSALAADDRPFAGDARGAPSLRSTGYRIAMAARDSDRRQSRARRVWHFPVRQPAPSAGARTNTADATGGMVLCRRDRAWRRTDAGTNVSGSLRRRP